MKLLTFLRLLFGPRSVASIVSDATALVAELQHTAEVQDQRSDAYSKLANDAYVEARHASRIAVKLQELVS